MGRQVGKLQLDQYRDGPEDAEQFSNEKSGCNAHRQRLRENTGRNSSERYARIAKPKIGTMTNATGL